MTFEISRAVRVNTPAFIALAGPSGSGKTRSGLELALGLAGSGKVLLADTEGNRALHYADMYEFDHVPFAPPYTPERCAELIDLAEKKGYAVLIVDSGSDEFEGEGGLQEIRETTKDEFWAKTKARHKHALINRIRRARVHVIFCLRCEERVRISKVEGRTVVEPLGWQPICEKRFLYEMQSSFRFDPERPGVPVPIKLYDIHAKFFPLDKMITRDAGERLAEWASGGSALVATEAPKLDPAFLALAESVADKGGDAFRVWWPTLSKSNRDVLRPYLVSLEERANKADEASQDPPQPEPEQDAERQSMPLPLVDDDFYQRCSREIDAEIAREKEITGQTGVTVEDMGSLHPEMEQQHFSVERIMVGRKLDAKATADALVAMVESHVRTQAHCNEFHRVNRDVMGQLKITNQEEHFRVLDAIAKDRE